VALVALDQFVLDQARWDRLVAIIAGERLRLVSRNGYDRNALFREPFRGLAEAGLPTMVLPVRIASLPVMLPGVFILCEYEQFKCSRRRTLRWPVGSAGSALMVR